MGLFCRKGYPMSLKSRLAFAGTGIGIIAGLFFGYTIVGKSAGIPDVLTLYFTGFGAGASLSILIQKKRNRKNMPKKNN
jgi:hypothetical protein